MVFAYTEAEIELFDLAVGRGGYGGYAMCERHAAALSAPVGWTLTDRRSTAPVLFPLGAVPPPPESDVA